MAGIDNITGEILQEARTRADRLIGEAEKNAEASRQNAEEEIRKMKAASDAKAEKDAADYAKRIDSQIAMRKRQAILAARQEIIDGVIESAYGKLNNLDDAGYFSLLEKLIKKNVRAEDGVLLLSAGDLGRMPEGFAEKAAAAAKEAGGSLRISSEAANIENGFLLRYGGIDENCTLKALFREKRDQLQDQVRKALW